MRTLETQTCHRHTYPFLPPPLRQRPVCLMPPGLCAWLFPSPGIFPENRLHTKQMPMGICSPGPCSGDGLDSTTLMTCLFHQHWPGLFPGWPWPTWQKSRLLLGTRASTRRSGALHLESGDQQVAKDTQRTGRASTEIPSRDNQHLLVPHLWAFQGAPATGAREPGPHRQHHSSGDTKRPGGPHVPPSQPGPPFSRIPASHCLLLTFHHQQRRARGGILPPQQATPPVLGFAGLAVVLASTAASFPSHLSCSCDLDAHCHKLGSQI